MADMPSPEEIQGMALELMESGDALVLQLTGKDSDFTLDFLQEKLVRCSAFQERLAEIISHLTRYAIPVLQVCDGTELQVQVRELELTEEPAYKALKNATDRNRWLKGTLAKDPVYIEHRAWRLTRSILTEAKQVVSRRAETMKRLDADIRLHEKILEAKVGLGLLPRRAELTESPRHRGAEVDLTAEPEKPANFDAISAGDGGEICLG